MTPQQQRFKDAVAKFRRSKKMTSDWKSFGACMQRELTPKEAKAAREAPTTGVCFRIKADAVRKFVHRNREVIDAFGGLLKTGSKGEFDAINERYDLKGKRRVVNIQQAIARALPSKPPFCLDAIDIDALNETAPARHGGDFRHPPDVEEKIAERRYAEEAAKHYLQGARRRRRRPARKGRR